jgi:hypothetical protein
MAALTAVAVASACAGPSSSVPPGFANRCDTGPRISGVAEMGVSNDGLVSEIDDLTVSFGGGTGTGACTGAFYEYSPDQRGRENSDSRRSR